MKRILKLSTAAALLLAAALPLQALETDLLFHMGNLDFAGNRSAGDTTIPGTVSSWGIDASVSQKIDDSITAQAGFTMDPVLRNTLSANLSYNSSYFAIEGGPFFGVFNTPGSLLKTGLRASLTAQIPGTIFLTFESGSTLGASLVQTGDYSEEMSEIIGGFYVFDAICSLHLLQNTFSEKDAKGLVKSSFREYSFQADVFQKNVPYNVLLKFAYQLQSKFFDYAPSSTQTLGSLVLGTRITVRVSPLLSIVTGLETNLYTFGIDYLSGLTASDTFLFRAQAGVKLDLDQLTSK
ncbi:hypothetical protein [Salinispira pacifica]